MNEIFTAIYAEPKTFFPYGENQILAFLFEEVIENWLQPGAPEDAGPITGYQYTGNRPDGGTLLECGNPEDYGCLTNAIIRSRYTESEEMAIHRHFVNNLDSQSEEWVQYNEFCEDAKRIAKRWLGLAG